MATANGTVKKDALEQFSRPRNSGLIALDLEDDNTLVGAAITNGSCDILLCAESGKATRFKESDVRVMGRSAKGVRLTGDQPFAYFTDHSRAKRLLLTASENGFGKRTALDDFPRAVAAPRVLSRCRPVIVMARSWVPCKSSTVTNSC